jgi:hypothetical protein
VPLSRDEQELLDGIEAGLRNEDAAFPARLTFRTAERHRRRQAVLAHGSLWLGMVLALIGFGLVHEERVAGALLILYGSGFLILALIRLLRLYPTASKTSRPPSS